MDARSEALAELMQGIFEHQEAGLSIPCVNPKLAAWWLSDDVEMQEAAALACSTCPALRNCREYVEQWPENGGVWAAQLPVKRGRRNDRRDVMGNRSLAPRASLGALGAAAPSPRDQVCDAESERDHDEEHHQEKLGRPDLAQHVAILGESPARGGEIR